MQWVRDIAQSSCMLRSQSEQWIFVLDCWFQHSMHGKAVQTCSPDEWLTKAYIESVVHRAFVIIAMLPKIQYVHNAIKGIYKSGALTSCLGGLNGCPPAI